MLLPVHVVATIYVNNSRENGKRDDTCDMIAQQQTLVSSRQDFFRFSPSISYVYDSLYIRFIDHLGSLGS